MSGLTSKKQLLRPNMIAVPDTGLCVAIVICPEESYLDLPSRAGSGHLQAGTGRQGALGLPPPITAPVVCTREHRGG